MICNICNATENNKVVIQKIQKDDSAFGGYKIIQAIHDKSDPIPQGFKLYYDGTVKDIIPDCFDCNISN